MDLPSPRAASAFGLGLAVLMLNPPVVQRIDAPTTTFGVAPLYLWIVFWGLTAVGTLLWAARKDAFGLSNDQVPPELRDSPRTPSRRGPPTGRAESPATDGGPPKD